MPCNLFPRFFGMIRVGNLFIFLFCGVVFFVLSSEFNVASVHGFPFIDYPFGFLICLFDNEKRSITNAPVQQSIELSSSKLQFIYMFMTKYVGDGCLFKASLKSFYFMQNFITILNERHRGWVIISYD